MTIATPRYCVLIPCLDEERAIGSLLRSVLAECPDVIVVDDGSSDRTAEICAGFPVILIRHAQSRGKGEALRTGFREVLRRGFDAVLTMDGDSQHAASDIPRLVAAAVRYPDSLVIGARIRHRERQPKLRRFANEFADWGISLGCGQRVLDTQSGQRFYPNRVLQLVDVPGEDFLFETELLICASWTHRVRVVAVPIESRYHSEYRRSHFRPLRDFTRITTRVVGMIIRRGHLDEAFRRVRSAPPLVMDPPPMSTLAVSVDALLRKA